MKLLNILKVSLSIGVASALCPTTRLGYPCCKNSKDIYYIDADAYWGVENNEWCGIPVDEQSATGCWSAPLGYPCCEKTTTVVEKDLYGSWGIENNGWCGINVAQPVQPQAPVQPQQPVQQPFQPFQPQQPQQPQQQQPAVNPTPTVNSATTPFPKAQKSVVLDKYILVKAGETYDGLAVNGVWTSYGRGLKNLGNCNDLEGKESDAVFRLETGATLKNVILGPDSIEHVHCVGEGCTVENVWWDDVCEDALSLKKAKDKNSKFYVIGGGARDGTDKIVQHNGAGTVYIKDFIVRNAGKLYRSCGNCSGYNGQRHVVIENVTANNVQTIAGINVNKGDTATFKNLKNDGGKVCEVFNTNDSGGEPTKLGTQCDGQSSCVCK